MHSTPTLRTERLLLTPLHIEDAPAVQQCFPLWEVVQFLNSRVPWPYPQDGALRYIEDVALPAIAQGTEWHWMIRLHSAPDDIIGSITLMTHPGNNRGFWLHPDWQGHGYMQEACIAINRYWFGVLGKPLMQVPKAAPNEASRRISQREGMRLVSTDHGEFVSGSYPVEVWEMTREEWLAGEPNERKKPVSQRTVNNVHVSLVLVRPDDFEALVDIRIEAMRESLERIGRFDPVRARTRFQEGFSAAFTRHIEYAGAGVGFVVVKPAPDGLLLDHLYIKPAAQGLGIGAAVLHQLFQEADAAGLAMRVGALKESASNRFYTRHGFQFVESSEFDNDYIRPCSGHV